MRVVVVGSEIAASAWFKMPGLLTGPWSLAARKLHCGLQQVVERVMGENHRSSVNAAA